MSANQLVILSVRLLVNSGLLAVKFWGVMSYTWIFPYKGEGKGRAPPNAYIVQGLTVYFPVVRMICSSPLPGLLTFFGFVSNNLPY